MRLSNNGLSTFRRCQRNYQYAYIDNAEPLGKSEALQFGSAYHTPLEHLWRNEPLDNALLACATEDPFRTATLRALIMGYDTLWKRDEFETIAVEESFEQPFDRVTIVGRMDAIAKDKEGRIWIVEHKTTSADLDDPTYWQQLRLDPQISMYWRALKKMGLEPYGCLYDVTRKPTIKPMLATPVESRKYTKATKAEPSRLYSNMRETDETPQEYFLRLTADIGENPSKYYRRATVARDAQDEFDAHMDDVWTITAIKHAEERGAFPRNPDSCRKFGSVCGYFPVCIREAELTDPTLYQIRKKAS